MVWSRFFLLVFSLALHGSVAGVLAFFSGTDWHADEQVYHVSLAEFAAPQPTAVAGAPDAAPVTPEILPPPLPEPEAAPGPEPEVQPQPPKQEEAKLISSKKDEKKPSPKKSEPKPKPARQQTAPAANGPPGPHPTQVGGYAAYKSDQLDQRPSISRSVSPEYPKKARRMNIEGKVLVQVVVDMAGRPKSCTVRKADPPGYFEEAALTAAAKMRFIPGKLKGRPVNTLVLLPFAFQLR